MPQKTSTFLQKTYIGHSMSSTSPLSFFCLVLWEQFPCFSLWINWMPLCNIFFSVLIFDLHYFSQLYKDNNLYTIIIVWNFNVAFKTVPFLKSFMLVCVLLNFYINLCAYQIAVFVFLSLYLKLFVMHVWIANYLIL